MNVCDRCKTEIPMDGIREYHFELKESGSTYWVVAHGTEEICPKCIAHIAMNGDHCFQMNDGSWSRWGKLIGGKP